MKFKHTKYISIKTNEICKNRKYFILVVLYVLTSVLGTDGIVEVLKTVWHRWIARFTRESVHCDTFMSNSTGQPGGGKTLADKSGK